MAQNLLVGIAGEGAGDEFESACSRLERLAGGECEQFHTLNGRIGCACVRDGCLVGAAADGDRFVLLLGVVQGPLPEWSEGSPTDDLDRTARYLLKRYREFGLEFLSGVTGQYVAVVGDGQAGRLVLACDPAGLRRLFYHHDGVSISFATTLAALSVTTPGGVSLNRSVEDFLLGYEFVPAPDTLFQGVAYLGPGEVLVFAGGQVERHSTPAAPMNDEAFRPLEPEDTGLDTASKHLEQAFLNAVAAQAPSSREVAVLLGGFDSALVAAALVRLGKRVETFTFKFPDYPHNQRYTDELARALGTRHTDVFITPAQMGEGLREYATAFNQPASQAHYVIQTLVTLREMRARGHIHALSGDGCDETFLGYPMVYSRAKVFQRFGVLPAPVVEAGRRLLGWSMLEARMGHPVRLARNVLTVLGRRMPERGHIANRILDEYSLAQLRDEPPPPADRDSEAILAELAARHGQANAVRLAFLGKGAVGVNRNRNEGATAGSGVSILSPFQHPGLKQVVASMPEELLRPSDATPEAMALGKYVLLHMAERSGLLPRSIIYQSKASPVTSPVDSWYSNDLSETVSDVLTGLPFSHREEYVKRLLTPKLAEDVFRKYGGISRYASHAVSMLATYAGFASLTQTES